MKFDVNIYKTIRRDENSMVLDVVCKMEIDEKKAKAKSEYKGKTYYFCAPGCKAKFDRSPEKYIKSK